MKLFFPYPNINKNQTYMATLRIINSLDIKKSDLLPSEVIVSKNYATQETLVAKHEFDTFVYNGRLYEKLINLEISTDLSIPTSREDKIKIMNFVGKYSIPYPNVHNISSNTRKSINKSDSTADVINWLFVPFSSLPQNHNSINFFEFFRECYAEFKSIISLLKSGGDLRKSPLQLIFNNYLFGNNLYLNPLDDPNYKTTWRSNSSLHLCYLELYATIMAKQKIKTCKYCHKDFEASKGNMTMCIQCRIDNASRKKNYYDNIIVEREKARERMKRLRNLKETDV
jgi:hypothetical protein